MTVIKRKYFIKLFDLKKHISLIISMGWKLKSIFVHKTVRVDVKLEIDIKIMKRVKLIGRSELY